MTMKIYKLTLIALCCCSLKLSAQYASTKVRSKYELYTDSLKQVKYDKIFPIFGQGAYKKGFDIPYPAGLMANFIWMKQNIDLENMQLGFKGNGIGGNPVDVPLTSVDFIKFSDNENTTYGYNFRPDLWIFPFLNVYGIFGFGNSTTEVNLIEPLKLQSVVEQDITTTGFGIMGAGGIGPFWTSVDANWTWNKPELLDEPVRVNVLGIRLGKTFTFNDRPDRNIAVWVGGMRTEMNTSTSGQITLNQAIPGFDQKTDEIYANYHEWRDENYDDLNLQQKLVVNNVLDPMAEAIKDRDGSAVIRYAMDKQVAQLWNGLIGAQFQLNKRWMLRSEGGVLGNRKSFLMSINYRFLF